LSATPHQLELSKNDQNCKESA